MSTALDRELVLEHELAEVRETLARTERLLDSKSRALLAAEKELEILRPQIQQNQTHLIQTEKMAAIGQLAAGVAHEINNPVGFVMSNLGTMTGYVATIDRLLGEYKTIAGMLASDPACGEQVSVALRKISALEKTEDIEYVLKDVQDLLGDCTEGTGRVRDIVQGLKTFARMDDADPEEADVNEGIEATLKIVWNELKYKCEVIKNLGDIPPIMCNLGQLNQVFMNLLLNAAQAIEEKGTIMIETLSSGSQVIIRISDTGCGVPEEDLDQLFQPFFTTKPAGEGTGLGLAISYGIIEKHGGTIHIESEVGKGTTFEIRLPVGGAD